MLAAIDAKVAARSERAVRSSLICVRDHPQMAQDPIVLTPAAASFAVSWFMVLSFRTQL